MPWQLGAKKKILCILIILLFMGSLVLKCFHEEIDWNDGKIMSQSESELFPNNGFVEPNSPQSVEQQNFTYTGENQTDTLLSFHGTSLLNSNTEDDVEIETNNWNVSQILMNFTNIHTEEVITVEDETPPDGYVTIYNSSRQPFDLIHYAMQFLIPDSCFIFRLKVYVCYKGNFSVDAKIFSSYQSIINNPGYPIPYDTNSPFVAISDTIDLITYGTENKTEWIEFYFNPRTLKAFLDEKDTYLNSFFVVLAPKSINENGGEIFFQWGYQVDDFTIDDGIAYEENILTLEYWTLATNGSMSIDLLLTNITYSLITWGYEFDVETVYNDFVLVYDGDIGSGSIIYRNNTQQFKIDTSAYLTDLQVFLDSKGRLNVWADIYNATQSLSSNPGEAIPDTILFSSSPVELRSTASRQNWVTFRFPNNQTSKSSFLNLYNTFNNSFFVTIKAIGLGLLPKETVMWGYNPDSMNIDSGFAYFLNDSYSPEYWMLYENDPDVGVPIDLCLMEINLISYELEPQDVDLKVNSTTVINYESIHFGGSVIFDGIFYGGNGVIFLDTTANQTVYYTTLWWCIFINQTYSVTNFQGSSVKNTIEWNVTIYANFPTWNPSTYRVGRYFSKLINMTFPVDHSIDEVRYKEEWVPPFFWSVQSIGGKKFLLINGTTGNWRIKATSPNYIEEIITFNGTTEVIQFYYGDEMNITAKIKRNTSVKANLKIYNRTNDIVNTSSIEPDENAWAKFPLWLINNNGTHYVVVHWFNGTEVGIKHVNRMCVYHTNLSMLYSNINASKPFLPTDIIYIDVAYNDTDNEERIPQGEITLNISKTFYNWDEDAGNAGVYNISIYPNIFENGNHTLRIRASKRGYNLSEIFVRFEIYIAANATLNVTGGCEYINGRWWISPDPYFDDQTHFVTLYYANGTYPYEGIKYAQIVANPNWTYTEWYGNPTNITPGFYDVQIDTEGLHEGDIGKVTITAYSQDFETKILGIYLIVVEIPINLLYIDAGQYSNITAYEGETVDIAVGYWDDFHGYPIIFDNPTEGNLTWHIFGMAAQGILEKSVWQYETSISLPEWEILGTQTYNITITATALQDYATYQMNLTLNVLSKENTTLIITNSTPTEYRVGHSFTVYANLTYENGTALIGGTVDFNISHWNMGELQYFFVEQRFTNQTGIAIYSYSEIPDSIDQIIINATYEGTECIDPAAESQIIPIIPKYSVLITIISDLPNEIMVGNILEIEVSLKNNETQLIMEDETIIFIIKYGSQNITRESLTNEEGQAIIEFKILPEMADYGTIDIEVVFIETPTHSRAEISVQGIIIMTWSRIILRYLPYIAILVAAIVGSYLSYRQFVIVPNRRRRRARMEKVSSKFADIVNLQHVLVLYSKTGMCIFQYAFRETTFDADLISGFLTAISAFQTEIQAQAASATEEKPFAKQKLPQKKEIKEEKGFELSYANFKILLKDGNITRTALILSSAPTDSIRESLNEFVKQFETKYSDVLVRWRGKVKPFETADAIVDLAFETSLLWPHIIDIESREKIKKLNSLENSLVTLALSIQQEKKYFFLPTLVDMAEKVSRESYVEILGSIDDLRKKQLFKAIPIEVFEDWIRHKRENLNL